MKPINKENYKTTTS